METLRRKAPAKINWFLDIVSKRYDGYHELDMLMQKIDLCDELSVQRAERNELIINGEQQQDAGANLIIRAAQALSAYTGQPVCAAFELTKRIPSMAGLGGGSSDCAQALLALNELYSLKLGICELTDVALKLGADVPFFLHSGLCSVRGIGEKIDELPSQGGTLLLIKHVKPGLSTKLVYDRYDSMEAQRADGINARSVYEQICKADYRALKSFNALERPAFALNAEIAATKQKMYDLGAAFAMMSGSGSAVYGVFDDIASCENAKRVIPDSVMAKILA